MEVGVEVVGPAEATGSRPERWGRPHPRRGGGLLSWLHVYSQPAQLQLGTGRVSLSLHQEDVTPGQGPHVEESLRMELIRNARSVLHAAQPLRPRSHAISRGSHCLETAPVTQMSQGSPAHLLSHSWSGSKG